MRRRGAALAPFGQTAFYGMRIVGLQPVDLAGRGGRGWGCGAGLAFGTWGCSVTPQREVMAVWGVRGVGWQIGGERVLWNRESLRDAATFCCTRIVGLQRVDLAGRGGRGWGCGAGLAFGTWGCCVTP